jgi:hypothetical protein
MSKEQRFKELAVIYVGIIVLISIFSLLKTSMTGYVTISQDELFVKQINATFTKDAKYDLILNETAPLQSLKISGYITGEGTARIYLQTKHQEYLVFDSSQLEPQGLAGLTGLVVLNESEEINPEEENVSDGVIESSAVPQEENSSEVLNVTPQEVNISIGSPAPAEESDAGEQEVALNQTISIILAYNSDTSYDSNDDGSETRDGVVDFTVKDTQFSWNADADKLCTKWEIYSEENKEATTVCYGAEQCCNFINIKSSATEWDEPYTAYSGKDGATAHNTISSRVMYVDYNLTDVTSEIYYSEWEHLPAEFFRRLDFADVCKETCLLPGLNESDYRLIIELDKDTELYLDNVSYAMKITQELDSIPPQSVLNLHVVNITSGGILLRWINPFDKGFAGVKVLRREEYYPDANYSQAILDAQVDDITSLLENGRANNITDTKVEANHTYFYRVYSYDTSVNYALGRGAFTAYLPANQSNLLLPVPSLIRMNLTLKQRELEARFNISIFTLENISDTFDLSFILDRSQIRLHGLRNISDMENISVRRQDSVFIKNAKLKLETDVVALNPINITSAEIILEKQEKVDVILQCKNYNFELDSCDNWKITDIPFVDNGTHILFTVTEFSAYAGAGLATINTKKSIYHPNETAEIIMVVLDTEGHLVSNAYVELNVTTPSDVIYSYSTASGDIIETSRGIYEVSFPYTAEEGYYMLSEYASGWKIDNSFSSYFVVKEYYEFDIIRNTPVTTDPWKSDFESTIKIISYTNTTVFDLTELVPVNFTLVDSGGATVTEENGKHVLLWANLSNNSEVSYRTQPPLITPELFELGRAKVLYEGNNFTEARSWYLAVDPAGLHNAMAIYGNLTNSPGPYYMQYIDGTWNGYYLDGNTGNPQWIIAKPNPGKREMVKAVMNRSGVLFADVWNNSDWTNLQFLSDVGSSRSTNRSFDVAIETNSSRVVIFYANSTAGRLCYRTWDGNSWSSESYYDVAAANLLWVRAEPKPFADSNEITVVVSTAITATYPDLYGLIWNGTALTNARQILANGSDDSMQFFDVAYEHITGDSLIVSGTLTTDQLNFIEWTGGVWGNLKSLTLTNFNGAIRWVRLEGNPSSNEIMFAGLCSSNDLNTDDWGGATWNAAHAEHLNGVETSLARAFDIVWVNFTGTQQLFLAWGNGTDGVSYNTWTSVGRTWNIYNNIDFAGSWTDHRVVQLTWDEQNKNVWYLDADDGSDINLAQYDVGVGWSGWLELTGNHSCGIYMECFSMIPSTAWYFYDIYPNISLISPLNASKLVTHTIDFIFNATTDDDFINCSVWTNETVWSAKTINTNPVLNNTEHTLQVTFATDGDYIWNVQCYDKYEQANFSSTNYTIKIDSEKPSFSNNNTGGLLKKYTNFSANITVTDNRGLSYVWIESNHTGTKQNLSYTSVSGLTNYAFNSSFNITLSRNNSICWRTWANDSFGNINDSGYNCFFVVNTLPLHSTPLINSADGLNRTNGTLTCTNQSTFDLDTESVNNLYTWFRNGTTDKLFHLPFEHSYTDLFGDSYSAESGTSFVKGKSGIGLLVDGTDYLNYSTINNFNYSQGTIEFWFNTTWNPGGGNEHFFFDEEPETDVNEISVRYVSFNSDLNFNIRDNAGVSHTVSRDITSWNANEWHHIVVVWDLDSDVSDGYNMEMYIDGSNVSNIYSDATSNIVVDAVASSMYIGSSSAQDMQADAIIDEFIIYDRVLSVDQIHQHSVLNYSVLVQNETKKNETWICQVTPNDGYDYGASLNTTGLKIMNTIPWFTTILGTKTAYYGYNWSYDANASDLDADEGVDILLWYINTSMISINGSGYLNDTPDVNEVGSYTINVTVNDGSVNVTQPFTYVVWDNSTPNLTLLSPSANYILDSLKPPLSIIFNCSAADGYNLRNISLYLSNAANASFALNKSATITGTSNYSNWTIPLINGNYTWNCLTYDFYNNSRWGVNQTITINYSVSINLTFSNGTTIVHNLTILSEYDGLYDIELELASQDAQSIIIRGYNDSSTNNLVFESTTNETWGNDSFAVSASGMIFSNMTLSIISDGTYLYKCPDWNMTNLTCNDDELWDTSMELTLGQLYNLTINSTDPGFVELVVPDTDVMDDGYALQSTPATEWGARVITQIQNYTGNNATAMYRFNISEIPEGMLIKDATLFLTCNAEAFEAGDSISFGVHRVYSNFAWTEGTGGNTGNACAGIEFCWNYQPSSGTQYNATAEDSGAFSNNCVGVQLSLNVTQMVTAAYTNYEHNISIYVVPNGTNTGDIANDYVRIATKENTNVERRPVLNITYTSIPNVTDLKPVAGTQFNVSALINISANVSEYTLITNVSVVLANITKPDGLIEQLRLNNSAGGVFYNATFTNTSLIGVYTIRIIANNTDGEVNASEITWFYARDNIVPNVSLNNPIPEYYNDTNSPVPITFNCSAADNYNLRNISLWLTNSTNQSFMLNQSSLLNGASNGSAWILNLVTGNYTWNCLAYDEFNNSNWSINRTVSINYTFDDTYPLFSNNETGGILKKYTNVSANVTVTDNALHYIWIESNHTGTKQNLSYTEITGLTSYRYNTSFNITLSRGNTICHKFYANDTAGNLNNTLPYFCFVVENTEPQFNQTPTNQFVNSESYFSYDINCSDLDADSITYFLNDSSVLSINSTTGLINGTPEEPDAGVYSWNISCSDGITNTSQVITFTVNDTLKPRFSANATGGLLQKYTNFTANITVYDNKSLNYVWIESNHTGSKINYSYTPVSGITLYAFNNSFNISLSRNNTVCWQAWANDTSGNLNNSGNNCFVVQNTAPTFNQTPLNQAANTEQYFEYDINCSDVDADSITYFLNDTSVMQINYSTGLINGTAAESQSGIYNWNVSCGDGIVNVSQVVSFTVNDAIKPRFSNNFTGGLLRKYTNFTANITVYDNKSLSYVWIESNHTGTLQNFTKVNVYGQTNYRFNSSFNISLSRNNTICWQAWANDTNGNLNTSGYSCFIVQNTAPTFNQTPANQIIGTEQYFIYDINCSDLDGDILVYSLNDTSIMQINTTIGLINGTALESQAGVYSWNISCSDGLISMSQLISFIINDTIKPRFIDNVTGGLLQKYTNYTASITVYDNKSLSYVWIESNHTGIKQNLSYTIVTGLTNFVFNNSFNISLSHGNTICWRVFANDTNNNLNTSEYNCFVVVNTLPQQTTPLINSTDSLKRTNGTLTCTNQSTFDLDNESVINLYTWFRNGTTSKLFHLPFEHSYTDLFGDTYLNQSSTSFNIGKFGYGLLVDGTDYLNYSVIGNLNYSKGTIEFWINTTWDPGVGESDSHSFFDAAASLSSNRIEILYVGAGLNRMYFRVYDSAEGVHAVYRDVSAWNANEWHHVAVAWNNESDISSLYNIEMYLDGSILGNSYSNADTAFAINQMAPSMYIGTNTQKSQWANAILDEFIIYSDVLSVDQINQHYGLNYNRIVKNETKKNETWICQVTPNDGYDYGISLNSTELKITNTAPWFVGAIGTQVANYNYPWIYSVNGSDWDVLEGVDVFSWYLNTTMISVNASGYLNDTPLLSEIGSYTINVTVSDGSINATQTFEYVVWDNTSPSVSLEYPPVNYYNDSSPIFTVNFNCSTTDEYNLWNISLFITDRFNSSFTRNVSSIITGTGNASNWSLSLNGGDYTWNCLVYDAYNNSAWALNRTVKINYTLDETIPLFSNNITGGLFKKFTNFTTNVTVTDNALQYVWIESNHTGVLQNSSYTYISGLTSYQFNTSFNISLSRGNTICHKFYSNDTTGNLNNTLPYFCFVVENTASTFNQTLINQVAQTEQYFVYDINCSDLDADSITYFLNDTSIMHINSTTGIINGTALESQAGVYIWNISCSDGLVNVSQVITFTVNDSIKPRFSNNLTGGILRKYTNFTANITIIDGKSLSYAWIESNHTGVRQNLSYTSISSLTNYLSNNSFNISVSRGNFVCWQAWANDTNGNLNNSGYSCFVVQNTAPSFNQTPVNQVSNSEQYFEYDINCSDLDGDSIAYFLNDTSIMQINSTTGLINGTAAESQSGIYNWNVSCGDGIVNVSQVVSFTVNDAIKPRFSNNFTGGLLRKYTNFTANITVYDNKSLSYVWIESNHTGTLQNFTRVNVIGQANYLFNSSFNISLIRNTTICWQAWANDTSGNLNNSGYSCFVVQNTAPTFNHTVLNQFAYSDIYFVYDVNCTDLDGDSLSYSLNDTSIMTINSASGFINGTAIESQAGIYSWNISCSDSIGTSSSLITFTVNDTTKPRFSSNITGGVLQKYTNFTANITITDGKNLSYVWIESNHTGSKLNYSTRDISGLATYTYNNSFNVSLSHGKTICWQAWANDSSGNLNNSALYCFEVVNTVPTQTQPIILPAVAYTNDTLICYNQSTFDLDNESAVNFYTWFQDNVTNKLFHASFENSYTDLFGDNYLNESTTSFRTGKVGSGLLVDDSDYINYSTTNNLNVSQGTIEFWINTTWNPGSGESFSHYFFDEASDLSANRFVIWYISGLNDLYFTIIDSSGNEHSVSKDVASWNANEWHHIAVTWDIDGDVSGSYNMEMHLDGSSSSNIYSDVTNNFIVDDTASSVYIGSSAQKLQQANAIIDEFIIYDKVLSKEQIQKHSQANYSHFVGNETLKYENWTCQITPNDGYDNGISLNASQFISNAPPNWLQEPTNQANEPGILFNYDINCSDIDGDTLSYYLNDTSIMHINASTGVINGTAQESDLGDYYWNISCDDGFVNISKIILFQVRDTTAPLFFNNITVGTLQKYTNFTANISIYDAGGLDWAWIESNHTGSMQNTSYTDLSGSYSNASFSLNITVNRGSTICWRVFANDTSTNVNVSGYSCFIVQNTAPYFNHSLANQVANTEQSFSYDINCSDIDWDSLVYYLNDTSVMNINSASGIISGTATEAQNGTYSWRIRCDDGFINASQDILFGVNDSTKPKFSDNITGGDFRRYTNFTANITVTDGVSLSYAWIESNHTGVKQNLSYSNVFGIANYRFNNTFEINISQGKTICWRSFANDSNGNLNASSINCFVVANTAPVFNGTPTDQFTNTGDYFYYDVNCTDIDEDALNYTLNDTTIMQINRTTGVINGSSLESQAGFYKLQVNCTDGLAVISQIINFTVNDTIKPRFSTNVTTGVLRKFTNFTANITVTDGKSLSYVWIESNHTGIPQNYSYASITGIISYRFNNYFNISLSQGNTICWRVYANDSNTNFNVSDYNCFIVQNTIPEISVPYTFDNATLAPKIIFERNETIFINVTARDLDNESEISSVVVTLINSTGQIVISNASMSKYTSVLYGYIYNYSYRIPADIGIGNWTIYAYVNDSLDATVNTSNYFTVADLRAPQYSNIIINDSFVYQYEQVQFNTTWTDDYYLNRFIFSLNQNGSWVNTSLKSLIGEINVSINITNISATPGTIVQWIFYTWDYSNNWNVTPIQQFTVGGVVWNQSLLDLGKVNINQPDAQGIVRISGILNNTNVNISCISGNCSIIAHNFTAQDLNNTNTTIIFNCSTDALGVLEANFTLNSSEDYNPMLLIVRCQVTTEDITAPVVNLTYPLNYAWLNSSQNINLSYTVNDTENGIKNCSLYVDGLFNRSNITAVIEQQNNSFRINASEGLHNWSVSCYDNSTNSNLGLSEVRHFTVDIYKPVITLHAPINNYNTTSNVIVFNFTVTDTVDTNLTCNITLNGTVIASYLNISNGSSFNYSPVLLTDGIYYWNVSCWDHSSNRNTTTTRIFALVMPPLNLRISIQPDDTAVLSWTDSSYESSYSVYYIDDYGDGFTVPQVTGLTSNTWTDASAGGVSSRYYKIALVRGDVEVLSNITVGKQVLWLDNAWNLISVPFNLTTNWTLNNGTNDGYKLQTTVADCVQSIYQFNGVTFKRIDNEGNNEWLPATGSEDFTALSPGRGYWFETNASCNVTFAGIVPSDNVSIPINANYDVVGWYCINNSELPTYGEPPYYPVLVEPENTIPVIYRYNAATDRFEITSHFNTWGWWPSFNNQDFISIEPGRGYYFAAYPPTTWYYEPITYYNEK